MQFSHLLQSQLVDGELWASSSLGEKAVWIAMEQTEVGRRL